MADALSQAELARYGRHLILPEIGLEGQQRLKAARVLIVGAGGLGSPVALYLAAAGVGTLGLVDFDVVDVTNLHRQILYGEADVGRRKLDAAASRIRDLNPHIDVRLHPTRLTRDDALDVLRDYDIVVDGTDNFPTRYLVNDACVLLAKPYVYGSIFRFEGQVSVFDAKRGGCYRCLFREPPPPGLVPSCAEAGVLGVLPGIIGSIQGLETIKLITGLGESLVGRLLLFDALAMQWRELRLRRNPECPVCGDNPTITGLIDYEEFCGMQPQQNAAAVPEVTPSDLKARLDRGDDITIVDVREPFEWEIGNLETVGARLIPMGEIGERAQQELDPGAEIVVHCRSGSRSARVVQALKAAGYSNVSNLKGGILAWADEVDPSIRKY